MYSGYSTYSTCSTYSTYSQMYKTRMNSCLYTSKINIYTNPAFQALPSSQLCIFPIYPPTIRACNPCNPPSNCTSCK